jgi:hypothetical protein
MKEYFICLWKTEYAAAEVAERVRDGEIERLCPAARTWSRGDEELAAVYSLMYFSGIEAVHAACFSVHGHSPFYWFYNLHLPL